MRKAEQPMYEELLKDHFVKGNLEFIAEKLGLTQRQVRLTVARAIRKNRGGDCHPIKPHDRQSHSTRVKRHIKGMCNQLDEPRRQAAMAERARLYELIRPRTEEQAAV
jgi:hypothetical protein